PFSNVDVIPFIVPIYDKGSSIGTVFLLAGTSVFTDKLLGYTLPSDSKLLLSLSGIHYEINGEQITPVTTNYIDTAYIDDYSTGSQTVVSRKEADDGTRQITVSYPVIDGVVLTQTLATNQLTTLSNVWLLLMLG